MYLNKWDESVHNTPDQQNRRENAKSQDMQILSLDVKAKSGNIKSRSGSVYQVTTENCSCTDFKVRRRPCKHMYMLDAALEKEAQKSCKNQKAIVSTPEKKEKSKETEFLLALLFGWMGAHRFYAGKMMSGLVWLLTGGLFFFGWGFDVLVLLIEMLAKKPVKQPINAAAPAVPEVKTEIVQQLPENTVNQQRDHFCAEFDLLMNNIQKVDVILRDETFPRKADIPSPYTRTSSITIKTNIKKLSNFVVIDVETTGLKAEEDDIIESIPCS